MAALNKEINKKLKEFAKVKEAFILEELTPYLEDNKLKQELKFRLREIHEVKEEFGAKVQELKDAFSWSSVELEIIEEVFEEYLK